MTWSRTGASQMHDERSRRRFLQFLAASPLLITPRLLPSLFAQDPGLIASPDLALNVFDFEAVARQKLSPAHFAYMATGVDDDTHPPGESRGVRTIPASGAAAD